jgi:hypothetical protein
LCVAAAVRLTGRRFCVAVHFSKSPVISDREAIIAYSIFRFVVDSAKTASFIDPTIDVVDE